MYYIDIDIIGNIIALFSTSSPPNTGAIYIDDATANVLLVDGIENYQWDGSNIVPAVPDLAAVLEEAKVTKWAELTTTYNNKVAAGVTSNALGTDHIYSGEQSAQLDLIGAKVAGVDVPFGCYDVIAEQKVIKLHTAAQMAQVFNDGLAFKLATYQTYRDKCDLVTAATTEAEVNAITWI